MTTRERIWLFGLAVLALLAFVEFAYVPGHNRLMGEINNAGHIPVFGLLAIALLHLLKLIRPAARQKLFQVYLKAFILTVILGAATEGYQYFGPRDADFADLIRDAIGAVSFLALYAAVRDRDLKEWRSRFPSRRLSLLGLTAVLWVLGGWGVTTWSVAFAHRNNSFPVVSDFSSTWSTKFLQPLDAHLDTDGRTPVAPNGHYTAGTRLHFDSGSWPGLLLVDAYPDWREYDSLVLVSYLEEDRSLFLGFSIADRQHNQELEDRYTTAFGVAPGLNRNAISLNDVRFGPTERELDLEQVYAIRIFSTSEGIGRNVLLLKMWLK